MGHLPKRYVFVDYECLKKIKVSKLGKVCNKVFIFISSTEENIPASLVMQAQHLGKRIKWISTDLSEGNGFMLHISFLIGALHQKENKSIEFAILSDDADYDALVSFINDAGRNCLRVKTGSNILEDEMSDEELFKGVLIEDSFLDDEDFDDGSGDMDERKFPEPIRKFKSA